MRSRQLGSRARTELRRSPPDPPDQRSYFGYDKEMQPNGFLVDAGQDKIDRLIPPPTDNEILAAGLGLMVRAIAPDSRTEHAFYGHEHHHR